MEAKEIKRLCKNIKRNYDDKTIRRLRDMKDRFYNKKEIKKTLKTRNPIIYRVYIKEISRDKLIGLTVMKPGDIGGEYYMTKGHKHKNPYDEIYMLMKGKGKLILQNKKARIKDMKKNRKIVISGKSAHRLVNTGKGSLEVATVYSKKAGKGFNVEFKKRVLKNGYG